MYKGRIRESQHLIEAPPLMSSETWKNVGKARASEGEPGSSPKNLKNRNKDFSVCRALWKRALSDEGRQAIVRKRRMVESSSVTINSFPKAKHMCVHTHKYHIYEEINRHMTFSPS